MENIKMMLAEIDELGDAVEEILSVADIDVEESDDESDIPALHEEYTSRMNRLRGMAMARVMRDSWLETDEYTSIEDGQLYDIVVINGDTGEPERMTDMTFVCSDSEFYRAEGRGLSSHVHMTDVTHYQVVELP